MHFSDFSSLRADADWQAHVALLSTRPSMLLVGVANSGLLSFFYLSAMLSFQKLDRVCAGRPLSFPLSLSGVILRAARLWPIMILVLALFPWLLCPLAAAQGSPLAIKLYERLNLESCADFGWLRPMLFAPNFGLGLGRLDHYCLPHTWFLAIDFLCFAGVVLTSMAVLTRAGASAFVAMLLALVAFATGFTAWFCWYWGIEHYAEPFNSLKRHGVILGVRVGMDRANYGQLASADPSTGVYHEAIEHTLFTFAVVPVCAGIATARIVGQGLGPVGKFLFGLIGSRSAWRRFRATALLVLALFSITWPAVAFSQCFHDAENFRLLLGTLDSESFTRNHGANHRHLSLAYMVLNAPSVSFGIALLTLLLHFEVPALGRQHLADFLSHKMFQRLSPLAFLVRRRLSQFLLMLLLPQWPAASLLRVARCTWSTSPRISAGWPSR